MWVLPRYYFSCLSSHFHEQHLIFILGFLMASHTFIVGFPLLQCSPPILSYALFFPIEFSDLVNPCLLHLYWIWGAGEQKNEKFMDLHLRELRVEWNRDPEDCKVMVRSEPEGPESSRGSDILNHRVLGNLSAPCLQSGDNDSMAPVS